MATRDILGTDRDNEFLQSFVRVGISNNEDDDLPYKSVYTQQKTELVKQASEAKTETTTPRKSRFIVFTAGVVAICKFL